MSTCPVCRTAPEVEVNDPRTLYECGTSSHDDRPGTFKLGENCDPRASANRDDAMSAVRTFAAGFAARFQPHQSYPGHLVLAWISGSVDKLANLRGADRGMYDETYRLGMVAAALAGITGVAGATPEDTVRGVRELVENQRARIAYQDREMSDAYAAANRWIDLLAHLGSSKRIDLMVEHLEKNEDVEGTEVSKVLRFLADQLRAWEGEREQNVNGGE